jgi:hypothetical protein
MARYLRESEKGRSLLKPNARGCVIGSAEKRNETIAV